MKNFIKRVFLSICGIILLTQGMILMGLRVRALPMDKFLNYFISFFQNPKGLDIVFAAALFLFFLGVSLLFASLVTMKIRKVITIKNNGGKIVVPCDAVKDFIEQALEDNSCMSGIWAVINKRGRSIVVDVHCAYRGSTSIREEIASIGSDLAERTKKVFSIRHFKMNFNVRSVDAVEPEPARSETIADDQMEEPVFGVNDEKISSAFVAPTMREEAIGYQEKPKSKKGFLQHIFKK